MNKQENNQAGRSNLTNEERRSGTAQSNGQRSDKNRNPNKSDVRKKGSER